MKGHVEADGTFWINPTGTELSDIVQALEQVCLDDFTDRYVGRINRYAKALRRLLEQRSAFDQV